MLNNPHLCFWHISRVGSRYRPEFGRPVFGRVLHKEPMLRLRDVGVDRSRTFNDIARLYSPVYLQQQQMQQPQTIGGGAVGQQQMAPSRRPVSQPRFGGGSSGGSGGGGGGGMAGGGGFMMNALTPQKGSFQRLKELVWTERARELQLQRRTEEMAARAAVLKELSNGHG